MNWFTKLFSSFFNLFRDGLEKFLVNNIKKAAAIAQEVVFSETWTTTHELVQLIWVRLRSEYPNTAGIWLSILANLAVDALKKNGVLK